MSQLKEKQEKLSTIEAKVNRIRDIMAAMTCNFHVIIIPPYRSQSCRPAMSAV